MKPMRFTLAAAFFALSLAFTAYAQDSAAQYLAAGNKLYLGKNYSQALRCYQSALKLNPHLWQAYEGLGNCELAQGDKAQALSDYRASLALNPGNPSLTSLTLSLQSQLPSGADSADSTASSGEDEEGKPFKPYWENEFGLSSTNQQAGQSTNALSYTGTQHFTEDGDFASGELQLERQKVEGAASGIGVLTFEGGLGLGFFSPALSIGGEWGQNAWHQLDGNLTLGFQLWDPLALNYTLGGNAGYHDGPVSQFYPSINETARIDTASWNTTLGPSFTPWDWWSISTTVGYEYDITYELQGIYHPNKKVPINQAEQIDTLNLALDFTLFKGFILDLAPQVGREYLPAGAVYNPKAGGLVFNTSPTSQNFVGGTVSVSYSFE